MNSSQPPRILPKWINPRRLAMVTAVLILMGGVSLFLRDLVREYVLLPLVNLGWLVWVALEDIPQAVDWALFLLVGLIVVFAALLTNPHKAPPGRAVAQRIKPTSRYSFWQHNLEGVGHSPFARERTERELQGLVIQVLSDRNRSDPDEIRIQINRGELDLSAEPQVIRDLFVTKNLYDHIQRTSAPRLWLARLLGRPEPGLDVPPLDVPGILAWLEGSSDND